MYYLVVQRRPLQVFEHSEMLIADGREEAMKTAVETIFGCSSGPGFVFDPEDILERYNLDVVFMDEEWQAKFDNLFLSGTEWLDRL